MDKEQEYRNSKKRVRKLELEWQEEMIIKPMKRLVEFARKVAIG